MTSQIQRPKNSEILITILQRIKYVLFPCIIYGPNMLPSNYLVKQLGPLLTLASYSFTVIFFFRAADFHCVFVQTTPNLQ